jgi:hypothetical protein
MEGVCTLGVMLKPPCVVWTTQAKVREVVQEEAKELLTVLSVRAGIQYVVMPILVGERRWNERLVWICISQRQKMRVLLLGRINVLFRPRWAVQLVGELHSYQREVDFIDTL